MTDTAPNQIKLFYEKSLSHRTIHVDGVWAGISPQGSVQLTIFNDLRPVPDYTLNAINPDGRIGPPVDKLEKDGIIRETEVTLLFRPETAEDLIGILRQMLDELKRLKEQSLEK